MGKKRNNPSYETKQRNETTKQLRNEKAELSFYTIKKMLAQSMKAGVLGLLLLSDLCAASEYQYNGGEQINVGDMVMYTRHWNSGKSKCEFSHKERKKDPNRRCSCEEHMWEVIEINTKDGTHKGNGVLLKNTTNQKTHRVGRKYIKARVKKVDDVDLFWDNHKKIKNADDLEFAADIEDFWGSTPKDEMLPERETPVETPEKTLRLRFSVEYKVALRQLNKAGRTTANNHNVNVNVNDLYKKWKAKRATANISVSEWITKELGGRRRLN